MTKYKNGTYHKGYFCGVSNENLKLIMCKDKIIITSILQSYVFNWHHTYPLHPGMDITEDMIHQHFKWPEIRDAVQKEVTNCDTFQRIKLSKKL